MKRMRAVESDSVKSARKTKSKLHKSFKERLKLVSELNLHRQKQNNAHGSYERHETVIDQRTSTVMHCCAEGLALQCLSLYYRKVPEKVGIGHIFQSFGMVSNLKICPPH